MEHGFVSGDGVESCRIAAPGADGPLAEGRVVAGEVLATLDEGIVLIGIREPTMTVPDDDR
jgi:hypothetical protein